MPVCRRVSAKGYKAQHPRGNTSYLDACCIEACYVEACYVEAGDGEACYIDTCIKRSNG